MKAKALAATDPSTSSTDITNYANDFTALRNQIAKIVSTSDFNGVNMIKTSGSNVMALASASGAVKVTVAAVNLGLGGGTVTVTAASTFTSNGTASAVLALVNTSITNVNAAVAKLGTGVNALQTQTDQLVDADVRADQADPGVRHPDHGRRGKRLGAVDADVAKESANLTALQTKQQLGAQARSHDDRQLLRRRSSSHILTNSACSTAISHLAPLRRGPEGGLSTDGVPRRPASKDREADVLRILGGRRSMSSFAAPMFAWANAPF